MVQRRPGRARANGQGQPRYRRLQRALSGAGYIPKNDIANCTANSKGLFAYYRSADLGFVLTCRMADGSGSGLAGHQRHQGLQHDRREGAHRVAANKALRSRNAKALEPGRYTVILEPRANARFLSLMTGIFGGRRRPGGAGGQGGPPGGGAAGRRRSGWRRGAAVVAVVVVAVVWRRPVAPAAFMQGKKPGDKIFSDLFTLKSDVGNPILRQSTIGPDNKPASPGHLGGERCAAEHCGANAGRANATRVWCRTAPILSVDEMIKQTRRGLLVTLFWYIRGVPSQDQPLLNTGMTRDGLFLIENGEIVGPVQNFRWNMSPLVGYNNLTLVGKPVPMLLGESFDSGNAALVPPVRIEEFYMTSVSPAV